MAETVVTLVLQQLSNVLAVETSLLTGPRKDFSEIQRELQQLQAVLKDADRRAGDKEGDTNEGIKTWVKQLREVSFRMEDIIDEYMSMDESQYRLNCHPPLQKIVHRMKNMTSRYRISSEIQHVKASLGEIMKRGERYGFHPSSLEEESSRGVEHVKWSDPRRDSLFIEATEVVGLDGQREQLIHWLTQGTEQLSVISMVGMGGIGKTTLAKLVFVDERVKKHFECCSFITVSQAYTVRGILIDMIQKICKENNEPLPKGLQEKEYETIVTEVRKFLESKRYFVLFDDVWEEQFFDEIELALPDNDKGSRIIITSRMMNVAERFTRSLDRRVHQLQLLPQEEAWKLFCKKAFRFEPHGKCPPELENMSHEIVQKCGGLPVAIVSIASLLSVKAKTSLEWRKVSQNLRMELERNAHLTSLIRILALSYDDLPHNLKSCILYFAMYPEDYTIETKRLSRQWMAEGFIKYEGTEPMNEVAEEYLRELIDRNLVQVSRVGIDGKIKSCRVHGILHDFLIKKARDLSFCHIMLKDYELDIVGITRRLFIGTCSDNVLRTSYSGIRAIFFDNKSELPEDFVARLFAKFKLLKVLDFQHTLLKNVPDNLGKLFHLRYLNLSHTNVQVLPRSICKLLNLETLDLRQTKVCKLPIEINNLTKLLFLSVYYRNHERQYSELDYTIGVKMQKGIGCLKSLEKLYFLEADHGGLKLMEELKMLKRLRKLGIRRVRTEYASALSNAIGVMNHLESLNVTAIAEDEIIDLNLVSPPPKLRVMNLIARVTKLPDWIPKLEYLVKLRLCLSNLEEDPLDSLKDMPNLLQLNMWDNAYAGQSLHFKEQGFLKLKELDFTRLSRLKSISIDIGALCVLERLNFKGNPQMKEVPRDLIHLKTLQFLGLVDMPTELVESFDPEKGRQDSVIKHIPHVSILHNGGAGFHPHQPVSEI